MTHLLQHWGDVLAGAAGGAMFWGWVGHMVSTMPPSSNPWVNWLIGGAQWLVGQRNASRNTLQGLSSTITASPVTKE